MSLDDVLALVSLIKFNNLVLRRQLDVDNAQVDFCASQLETRTLNQLLRFIGLELNKCTVDAAHVLNVEIARLAEVADDEPPQFRRQVWNFWVSFQMLFTEDFKEFKVNFWNHSLLGPSVCSPAESIFVEYPKMNSADGEVIVVKYNIIHDFA